MFTFGRDHEKACAAHRIGNAVQASLLLAVIDAVHDRIDGVGSEAALIAALRTAFTQGGSGVWESTASWLRKSSVEYPTVLTLWAEWAEDPRANIRYRVACVLDELSVHLFESLSPLLARDRSQKVSTMAKVRIEEFDARKASGAAP